MKKIMNNLLVLSKTEIISNKLIIDIMDVSIVVILISLGAFVRIYLPFTPVPITLQTFFVMIGSAYLSKILAPTAIMIYLILGASGLPIFAGAESGIAKLLGPTGGYLFGFLLASVYISYFIDKAYNKKSIAFHLIIGSLIILLCGSIFLSFYLRIPLIKGFYLGILPFLPGDILKVIIATLIYHKLLRRRKK